MIKHFLGSFWVADVEVDAKKMKMFSTLYKWVLICYDKYINHTMSVKLKMVMVYKHGKDLIK